MDQETTQAVPASASRRRLLKAGALAGAGIALGITPGCRSPQAGEGTATTGSGPTITIAGYPYDRVAAIAEGRIGIEGCRTRFERAGIYDLNAMAMGGDQRWEVQEIGLHPLMLAWANEEFRDYALVPVFPLRTFRHKSIFVNTERGITTPEELRGRKVAFAAYSQSSLVWIRGNLQHEYGVSPEELEWVVASKASDDRVQLTPA